MRKGKVFAPRTQKQEHYYDHNMGRTPKEVLTDEDQQLLEEEEVPELTYFPFRTKAFKKVIENKTNIGMGLNNEGAHVLAINNALSLLKYNVFEDSIIYNDLTQQAMKAFQIKFELTPSGFLNAETLKALNKALESEKGVENFNYKKRFYNIDPDLIQEHYPLLSAYIIAINDESASAPLFKEPFEGFLIEKEHLSSYVYADTPLYVIAEHENGWLELKTSYGTQGFLPKVLTTAFSNMLPEVVITSSSKAYEALEQLIAKDSWYKNLDDDRAIGLMRAFNTTDQEMFLNDKTLQQSVLRYLNVSQMIRALQGFEELPLEKLDTFLSQAVGFFRANEVSYILYRNLLLKSEAGQIRELEFRNKFEADDSIDPNELVNDKEELKETEELEAFESIHEQLNIEGMPNAGFHYTKEEQEAIQYLLRFEIKVIPKMRETYDGSMWNHRTSINRADHYIGERGFGSAKVYESQKLFLAGFRRNTLRLALETLDISERAIAGQYQSILNGEIDAMKRVFLKHRGLYDNAVLYESYRRKSRAKFLEKSEEKLRSRIAQEYPLFYDEEIKILEFYETLVIKNDTAESEEMLKGVLDEKLESIDETRENLLSDEDLLWKLEGLITLAKDQLIPFGSEELNTIVNRKVSDETYWDFVAVAGIAALSIGLAVATYGASTPLTAGLLAGTSFAVGIVDSAIAYEEYTNFSAASNTAIDPDLKLTNKSPWVGWVVLSIVGAGLDALSMVKAIKLINNLDTLNNISHKSLKAKLINSATKEGITLGDKVFENIAAMAAFRRKMLEWYLENTDKLKMPIRAFEDSLDADMARHYDIAIEAAVEGIDNPQLINKWGEMISNFSGTRTRNAQSQLLHKAFGSTETLSALNQAERNFRALQDLSPTLKIGVDNLWLHITRLTEVGKINEASTLIKEFNKIADILHSHPAHFEDMFRTAVLSGGSLNALETFEGIAKLYKLESLNVQSIRIISKKVAKSQISKESFNWILKYADELDAEAIKLFRERLPKNALDRYIKTIISQMDEGADVSAVVRAMLQRVSRFEKARDILNKKGYRALARIAEEGLDYFTLVNKQMKDFIKAAPEDEFIAFLNQYRRGGEPGAEFMPLYKNFGEGMERLRKLGPDGKITNKMLQEVMKDMRRHHMIMSNVLKDNEVFQKIMQWALTRVPPKKIGFNDFRKNIIILHDSQHGFHPTASGLMNKKIKDINNIFNQTERKINSLKELVELGTDKNFSKAFNRLKNILEDEQNSIIKNVIQKENGHLDTKHIAK